MRDYGKTRQENLAESGLFIEKSAHPKKNKRATDRRDVEKHEEFPFGPIPRSLLRFCG
jgi:hypothetical protein